MIRICVISRDRGYYERLSLALGSGGISLRCAEPGADVSDAVETVIWDEDDLGDPPGDLTIDGRLTGNPEPDSSAGSVFKYGSVDSIAEGMTRLRKSRRKTPFSGAKRIAFVSYSGGSGTTCCAECFSYAAASECAGVLLIRAENCSGGPLAGDGEDGLSDLLFALSRDSDAKIDRFLCERDGVFQIRPPRCERDRILLDAAAYGSIIAKAEASGRFQLIVTDVSFSFGGLCPAVLESCDSIFVVTENTVHAKEKLARGLSAAGEEIKKKMRFVVNRCSTPSQVLPGVAEPVLTLPVFREDELICDMTRAFGGLAEEETSG